MSESEILRLRLEVAELRELVTRLVERVSALEASEGFELVPELARGPASRSAEGSLHPPPNPSGLGSSSGTRSLACSPRASRGS